MSCHSTHFGLAATQHARAVTDLDDAQVSSIFHRLKNTHADAPAPSAEEAIATLIRLRREALEDVRLPERSAYRLADRYAHAIEAVSRGHLPDGRTWAAMQETALEAEIAERNLNLTLRAAARHQRINEDDLAEKFQTWRRGTNSHEDLDAFDPEFRIDPADFPSDKYTQRALRKLGFENELAQRLPCFVYGTLRKNQGNSHIMEIGAVSRIEGAHVDGVAVYGAGRGFPYAQEAPDGQGTTTGDLVYLSDDEAGDHARGRLDRLEGFDSDRYHDSHYRRVARDVTFTDPATGTQRTVKAWTYLAGGWAKESLTEDDRIHHGDWVRAREEYRRAPRPTASHYADDYDYDDLDSGGGYDGYDGEIVITKRAVDPNPPRTAAASAAVFAAAGVLDEEPAEDAGFWSQYR